MDPGFGPFCEVLKSALRQHAQACSAMAADPAMASRVEASRCVVEFCEHRMMVVSNGLPLTCDAAMQSRCAAGLSS